jgi:hypothetical protein
MDVWVVNHGKRSFDLVARPLLYGDVDVGSAASGDEADTHVAASSLIPVASLAADSRSGILALSAEVAIGLLHPGESATISIPLMALSSGVVEVCGLRLLDKIEGALFDLSRLPSLSFAADR